jgi:hypothetical protein
MESIDIERILLELECLPEYDDWLYLQKSKGDPKKEQDFTEFAYDIPYTNTVIEKLNMFRTRVMRLRSKTCYSYHKDPTQRIHIPLITNESCFILLDREAIHLPADGRHFIVDTTRMHTAINASWTDRIHLVGCFE